MIRFPFLVVLSLAASVGGAGEITLTDGWEFRREGAADWQAVRVPHDWAISGPFDAAAKSGGTGKLPWKGKGEYRRTLALSADDAATLRAGGRAYLTFDGVMSCPRVRVNGKDAGGWDYGYLGFTLDVTDKVRAGDNLVEVSCDNTHQDPRWYPGAGIYRRVRFAVRPRNHVIPGTLAITVPEVAKDAATVRVAYRTPEGPTNYSFRVANPRLWDVDDPYLYALDLPDERVRYGIRTFRFTPDDGFHLNGRRVQLKGANLHADLGLLGMAFDRSAMRRQLHIMKEMGVNAIRTSHNPPAPEMLDLCDEMGILVWDECFDKWEATAGRRPDQNLEDFVVRNLRQFVRRDRNHPSVVVWSVSNEIWEWDPAHPIRSDLRWSDRGPEGQTKARNDLFAATVKAEDPTRPVGCGNRPYMNEKRVLDLRLWDSMDVIGWNYYRSYADAHAAYPDKGLVYSESASAVSTGGFFADRVPEAKFQYGSDSKVSPQVDGMDLTACLDIADAEFDRMERDRYVAGEFVWTGIDYLGEPSPFDREARSSYFGCVDLTGRPKDRFYLYRAHWKPDARTLHIVPHWNWEGTAHPKRTVMVYTNGDEAELFLNGRSLGRHRKGGTCPLTNAYYSAVSKYRLIWTDVAYEPGELKAVAWKGGVRIGEETVRTAGAVAALRATVEPRLSDEADELRWVGVEAVDAKGVPHPFAKNRVSFRLEGPGVILGVGNGDPTGMKPFTETESHDLFFGKAMAVIRRTGPGRLALTVSAEGLRADTVEIGFDSGDRQLSKYVRRFNADDDELYANAIPNAETERFLSANVPRFECPDADIERTYYFRWWTYRKHLRRTSDGWIVTEFLPTVPWAATNNAIVCALGHHIMEGRWLRDNAFLDDYARFWFAGPGGRSKRAYTSWPAFALDERAKVTGDRSVLGELYDPLVDNLKAWDGCYGRTPPGCAADIRLAWIRDASEGSEISCGGHGYRPLINSVLWAEASTLARLGRAFGKESSAAFCAKFAERAERSMKSALWHPERRSFTVLATNGVHATVRELHGFMPWYVRMPLDGHEDAWRDFMDPEKGFFGRFGLTVPERCAPGFRLDYTGHDCKWNGPSWPFATAFTLTAMANALHARQPIPLTAADYVTCLRQYAAQQRLTRDDGRGVPWIDEDLNPDTGDWIARTILIGQGRKIPERGKDYNHSTYCDLVISGLVGLVPQDGDSLVVDPLFPKEWKYLALENVRYHGHDVSVRWDPEGTRYGTKGFSVFVDGRLAANAEVPSRLDVVLPQGSASPRAAIEVK